MPAPEHHCAFFLQTDRPIGEIIDALRPLRMRGTLPSVVHVGNDYKVLSSSGQYPWKDTNGETPLSREAVARLRTKHSIGRWNASGGLYGTRAQVREARAILRRAVSGKVSRLKFVDQRRMSLACMLEKPYRMLTGREDLSRALRLAPPLLGLLAGTPTNEFLKSAYWRKKTPPPADANPDRDACGLLWASPVAPASGADVQAVADIAEEVLLAHRFEPLISVSLINERAAVSTISLTYDREVPGEDARAVACYRDVTNRLLERGYPPYRLNTSSMDVGRLEGPYGDAIRAMKRALDPNGILAPGRYE
jgi:4-cresol dehydrogenase (hydroxylating) flavoprotein subunit